MGIALSVNLSNAQGARPITTATAAMQTENFTPARDLSWTPIGYTLSMTLPEENQQTLPASLRFYIVYKTNLPYNIEGIHWGTDTIAYRGLRTLGWGSLRKWKRLTAWNVELLTVEALEGDESLQEPLVWYRWQ